MTGGLNVFQAGGDIPRSTKVDKPEVFIHSVHPGEIVGGLAVLTGEASAYTIRAKQSSRIAFIERPAVYQCVEA